MVCERQRVDAHRVALSVVLTSRCAGIEAPKSLADRAARDFVSVHPGMKLSTISPGVDVRDVSRIHVRAIHNDATVSSRLSTAADAVRPGPFCLCRTTPEG